MKRKLKKAALIGLCVSMTMGNLTQILAETRSASGQNFEKIVTTGSNALPATGSNGIENYALRSVKTGDLWKDWIGDLSFLNGERGDGTEEEPYQISTKAHLMGLSELAARGMVVDEDEVDIDKISVGCKVRILDMEFNEELEYKIVGSTEANSLKGKISNESPVGKALIGKKKGDVVEVETQVGALKYKVLQIERAN